MFYVAPKKSQRYSKIKILFVLFILFHNHLLKQVLRREAVIRLLTQVERYKLHYRWRIIWITCANQWNYLRINWFNRSEAVTVWKYTIISSYSMINAMVTVFDKQPLSLTCEQLYFWNRYIYIYIYKLSVHHSIPLVNVSEVG